MSTDRSQEELGSTSYVVGGLSFVPLVGVLFGMTAICWGLLTEKRGGRKLVMMGIGGIAFTLVTYSALFYFGFVQRGGVYDKLREQLTTTMLTDLVPAIEFYKTQYGHYPESLEALKSALPAASNVMIDDPSVSIGTSTRSFYYELADSAHYYLLAVGADGVPFTKDDVKPSLRAEPRGGVGLIEKP